MGDALTETQRIDFFFFSKKSQRIDKRSPWIMGPMEARCVLRALWGHGILHGPESRHTEAGSARRGRRAHRHGTAQRSVANPGVPSHRQQRIGVRDERTLRRLSDPSSRSPELPPTRPRATWPHAGGIAAAYGLAQGSGRHRTPRAGTKQQRLALSWNRSDTGGIYQNACLFPYCLCRLSCPFWVAAVECAEVSLCVHDDWSSQVCFQAMISPKLGWGEMILP